MFRSLQLRNDRSKRFGETSSVQSSSGDGDDESDPRWRFPNDNRSIHSNFSSVRDTDDDSVVEEDCIGATTSIASSGSDHDEKSKVNARKPRQGFSPSPQSPRRISNKLKGILRRNKSLNSDDDDESSASPFDRSNNKKNNSVKNCSPRRRRSSLYSKHSITSSCADSAAETKTTSEMLMLSSSFGTALDASWRSSDNSSGMVQSPSSRQKQQKHKRVHHHVLFSFVEIREYVRIVGDNPSVSSGPPMSIDWVYYPDIQKYAVNDFEAMQIPYRRSVRDLALPRQIREELLQTEWDVTAAEMAKAIREVNRVKNQRRNTIHHRKSGWERVDRVVERTSATVMRSLKLKKVSHLLDQNTALAQELERQYFRSQEEEHQQQQQIEESEELMVESTSHSSSSPLDDNSDYANYCSTMPDSSPTPLLPPDFEHHPHPESYISQVRRARTKNGDDISEALIEALASKLWNSSFASRNKPKSDDSKNTVSYYEGNGGNYEYDFEFDVDDERSEYFIDPDCSYHPHQVGSYNCDDHAEDDASESWGRYGMLGRSADGVK